jgi:hypothetical protein
LVAAVGLRVLAYPRLRRMQAVRKQC